MLIEFFKYQGAGNDFIIIDAQNSTIHLNSNQIKRFCDRHFGVGADGMMLLNASEKYDFAMHYFNADGKEGTMCGNGGRCIVHYAHKIGLIEATAQFEAIDGLHEAKIIDHNVISLKMSDIDGIRKTEEGYLIDTGSPHLVIFTKNLHQLDVLKEARKIRYNRVYKKNGINVNYVEIKDNKVFARTYERGVENETLACGTGAVAMAAILYHTGYNNKPLNFEINAIGGTLNVRFGAVKNTNFEDVYLTGPAQMVYSGKINLSSLNLD